MGENRHVMITGVSRGLGAYLTQGLLREGYRVSACSRSRSPQVEALLKDPSFEGRFFWEACEVGDAVQVESFVSHALAWAGDEIYGLINNAAIAQAGILASFPNVESERILKANLLGPIQLVRAISASMLRGEGGGRIINISSIIGSRGYNGMAAYSASKAGLDGLTRALARELGKKQITVNSVAPGYMKTEMSASLNTSQLAQIVNRTPLRRLADEEDVFALVRFLLSDGARMITGQTVLVDGGISC